MHATYKTTVEPTQEPLRLEDLKSTLRITNTDFDVEIARLLVAARRQVEHDARRKLMSQTVAMYLDEFPKGDELEIRLAPVTAISSVAYVDEDEASQTFSSAKYTTDLDSTPPRIVLKEDDDWPDTEPGYPNAVTVTMTAGYATREAIPAEAALAIIQWVKLIWGGCENASGDAIYQNLMSHVKWTEYHVV